MTPKDQICVILHCAFLDIRACAGEKKVCFALADVLHNVPLAIARAIDGQTTFEEILAEIRERFQFRKCEAWLDNIIAHHDDRSEKLGD